MTRTAGIIPQFCITDAPDGTSCCTQRVPEYVICSDNEHSMTEAVPESAFRYVAENFTAIAVALDGFESEMIS
jgi:hypothetical protein